MANAGHATADPATIALTRRGRDEAAAFANWLPALPDAVWTSTYQRACDTAAPTLSRFSLQPRQHAALHEFVTLCPQRCAGTAKRERMPWVDAYWQRSDPDFRDGAQSETFAEFDQRVHTVRRDLHDSTGTTLVFGHGMFFALWLWQALGFDSDSPAAMAAFRRFQLGLPMPNTGVYRLIRHGERWWPQVHGERLRDLAAETRPAIAIQ